MSGRIDASRLEAPVGVIASASVLLLVFAVGAGAGRVLAGEADYTALLGSLAVVGVAMILAFLAAVIVARVARGG